MARDEPRCVRVERLFRHCADRAYVLGLAGRRELWLHWMKRAQRIKAMRAPAVVAYLEAERMKRVNG